MGIPVTGAFARATQASAPYAGAAKWGTGINPIHAQYAGPGRPFGPGVPSDMDQRTPPSQASEDAVEYGPPWGAPDDPSYLDSVASEQLAIAGVSFNPDDHPAWGENEGTRDETDSHPSWGESNIPIRSRDTGPSDYTQSWQQPTETVSEGWINKGSTGGIDEGRVANAEPSADSQIFVRTSMTQRYKKLSNERAQLRHSDAPREPIDSRVVGQKLKVYSGGERHYDMQPRHIDDIPRPFYFRTAATGPSPYLYNNAFRLVTPMQRTPPPDPSQGIVDTALTNPDDSGSYGYTSEDWGYF